MMIEKFAPIGKQKVKQARFQAEDNKKTGELRQARTKDVRD